jgi:CCR4-NOT transcription complex subunit 3
MLERSFKTMPEEADSNPYLKTLIRIKYTPKNPYPVPGYYPQQPLSIFTVQPTIFSRFQVETLFFIFYRQPQTIFQQYAARQLLAKSWRFHTLYSTWFQRHEEPSVITDNYEQGKFLFFDYQVTWSTQTKTNFKFEYRYLQDDF